MDRDRDGSRDNKSLSREKQTLPRGRGSGSLSPQLENIRRKQMAEINRWNLERLKSVYFAWRKSGLPSSSFKYPIIETYPFQMDDSFTVRTPFFIPRYNETGWQQGVGLSFPSSNTRDSNLGLEQTNLQYHYQPEAFVGMEGSSSLSSSSLNFPSEPTSNQRNDTTNLPEKARMDGRFVFRQPIPIPGRSDTMARHTNERNPQQSNLGLEQTNQQYHYQSKDFAHVRMDGSSSSSLNFSTEPSSHQRSYTTTLSRESMMDGSFVFRTPIPIPSHNGTMAQQTNERNPQESNSGLEKTNQLFDYQLEAFAGVNVQMDGSSSLNFPREPLSNQRYLGNYTTNLTEEAVTSETPRHQGISLPPWNYQESNLGLEQTDQPFDYRLEAFLGVDVQMEGSSSSSSLNFPEESPSTLRNYTTNLPEEARIAGMKRSYPESFMFSSPSSSPSHNEPGIGWLWNSQESNLGVNMQMDESSSSSSLQFPTEPPPPSNQRYCGNYTTNFSEEATTFGYRHPVVAPARADISASRGNLNIGHFSSQDIGGEGGSSSSHEPNPKKQKMKENAFTDEDLYMLTQAPAVSTRIYQSSNPSASAKMDSRHEYPVHRSVPARVPTNLPPRPSLHRQRRGSGWNFPLQSQNQATSTSGIERRSDGEGEGDDKK